MIPSNNQLQLVIVNTYIYVCMYQLQLCVYGNNQLELIIVTNKAIQVIKLGLPPGRVVSLVVHSREIAGSIPAGISKICKVKIIMDDNCRGPKNKKKKL
jgi:hypothetical protein